MGPAMQCPVCFELVNEEKDHYKITKFQCGHELHSNCAHKKAKQFGMPIKSKQCPFCDRPT